MKKNRSKNILTKSDYEQFNFTDTRYYGLFYSKKEDSFKVKIDPKRFCQSLEIKFDESVSKIVNSRQTHYFYPRKDEYHDYNCNVFESMIDDLREYWTNYYKSLIVYANDKIERPEVEIPAGNDLFMRGIIIDYDEMDMINRWENAHNEQIYRQECFKVLNSLYASFVHQMASQIESVTVYVLNRENAIKDLFNRNMLYSTAVGKGKKVDELQSFRYYDMLYCLWNFIKHNSLSTYEKLKQNYPDLLVNDIEYEQGIPAFSVIVFSEELIMQLLDGCSQFFKEYCKLVFNEEFDEAQWNYGRWFYDIAMEITNLIGNPLGLPFYL